MVVIVVRHPLARTKGILRSVCNEVRENVFVSPFMTKAVFDRLYDIISTWENTTKEDPFSGIFIRSGSSSWRDMCIRMIGGNDLPIIIEDVDGIPLISRKLPKGD